MRKIQFRGIKVPEKEWFYKEWVYGDLIQDNESCHIRYREEKDSYSIIWECLVRLDTVGQFTGIIDDDKNPIWEGDIVEIMDQEDSAKINCEVIFEDARFIFYKKEDRAYLFGAPVSIKVIGNVHENPELLDMKNEGN